MKFWLRFRLRFLRGLAFCALASALLAPQAASAGVEVWRDPAFDVAALRKVFVLPIDADLRAGGQSAVQPNEPFV